MRQDIILGEKPQGGSVRLNLEVLLKTRLLIQANSGGGKSWAIRRIAEQMFSHLPIIIIDPEGEFATLREKFGFVLVGKGGETPADPRSIKVVMEKLLELRASAVIDLYEMNPAERHRCVRLLSEAAIDAPKKLWRPTVFIFDEAHTFCPEKGAGESEASDAVTAFPTRGRKRRFCAIFATQRLGKLRKDASAELLNRLVGPTFEDVDLKRAAELLSITGDQRRHFDAEMRLLDSGNFYALGRAVAKERVLFKVGPVLTSHEIEDAKYGSEPPPPPEKIKALLPQLADLPKQAEEKAKTEADLRLEIRSLKTQLTQAHKTQPAAEVKNVAVLTDAERTRLTKLIASFDKLYASAEGHYSELQNLARATNELKPDILFIRGKLTPQMALPQKRLPATVPQPITNEKPVHNGVLPYGEKKILTAAAQYQDGATREQLTVLTGFKRSTRDAYIARLRDKNYVAQNGENVIATREGLAVLGPEFEPLPTGDALIEYWQRKLPHGERVIWELAIKAYPDPVQRESLEEVTGFKRSTRDAYISRSISRKVLEAVGPGQIRAAKEFFE
jgi:regulator of replication initiation timing